MLSTPTYYRYLKNLVYQCTYDFWLKDQAETISHMLVSDFSLHFLSQIIFALCQEMQDATGKGARCAGDGRFDSPGWSARYCNYFIQVH